MEANILIDIINAVGFPIVVAVGMYYMNMSSLKQQRETLHELQRTLDRNTNTMDILASEIRRGIGK